MPKQPVMIPMPEGGFGELSDGYHTFNELYHHRAILFSAICNIVSECAWKSKLHSDGTMYDGMFIVGINTPKGQATYHYDIDPYWDMFDVEELPRAPQWDGHTPAQAIERIKSFGTDRICRPMTLEEFESIMRNTSENAFFYFEVLEYNGYRLQNPELWLGLFDFDYIESDEYFKEISDGFRYFKKDYGIKWRVWIGKPQKWRREKYPWDECHE